MRLRDNSILEINTAESGAILISKESSFDDYGDKMGEYYTISEIEGYGGFYWGFSYIDSIEECFQYLENPPRNFNYNRDYLSWWLLRKPLYIDESMNKILIERLLLYNTLGEIEKAIINRQGNYNSDNLFFWLNFASIDTSVFKIKKSLAFKIPIELNKIDVRLEGFDNNLIIRLIVRANRETLFQSLLDIIYKIISNEVNAFSYGREWILFNQTTGDAINKKSESDLRNLISVFIRNNTRLICKKLNYT
jgi:hypothetical protein